MKLRFLAALLVFGACEKSDAAAPNPESKLLGERLIAAHGEGVLASPVLVVYDSGFIAGSGSVGGNFSANLEKVALKSASGFSAGRAPVAVREYYSEEGVEFGVSEPDRVVVVDSTSSLTIRLLFGQPGIKALRACEAVKVDRVCKVKGEMRAPRRYPGSGGDVDRGWLCGLGSEDPAWMGSFRAAARAQRRRRPRSASRRRRPL